MCSWTKRTASRFWRRSLLSADLPIEQVIIPHGELIAEDGAARIRAAVADAQA